LFEDWMKDTNAYILRHIDHKPFHALDSELEHYIDDLSVCYIATLTQSGAIDADGNETGLDLDEDDLLEWMLERFDAMHPTADDDRALLYAMLADVYLRLVRENSEEL
jgi:hypothetical protein